MTTIPVKIKNSYLISVENGIFEKAGDIISRLNIGNFTIIIVSRSISRIYAKKIKNVFKNIPHAILVLPDGEAAKSQENLFKIISYIIKHDTWGRKIFITAIGGGTIGDVAGFAAAIYKRATPYINIPTTLLAQVDSSIGGKTAIDTKEAKNILGAFHQPSAVIIDPMFLSTLPSKQFRHGLAEVIKYAAIWDKRFFFFLKNQNENITALEPAAIERMIVTCARIKAIIVSEDEFETKGIRTILNFGHTLAHALETYFGYKKLSHGEAVAIGMVYASQLGCLMKKCTFSDAQQLEDIIKQFCLPTTINAPYDKIHKAMSYDKKFIHGKARMVLMTTIGKTEVINGIPPKLLINTLKKFCQS